MGMSQSLLIPRSSGLPVVGRLLRIKADTNVTQGGATGFTVGDKCRLAGDAIDPGTADFWVELWFSVDSVTATGNRGLVGTGAGGVGDKGFSIYQVNNAVGFILSDGTGTAQGAVAAGIAASTPYHVVCCFDRSDKMTPYVNGAAGAGVDISTCQLTLGSAWAATVLGATNATEFFGGALQCVRVGIGSLPTAAEIADLYNNRNPLAYAQLPAAIVAKLGASGAAWDLNESLIDPTHQAKDSHGTNHLTFTRDELATNGAMTTDTGWTKGTGWTVDADDSNTAASDGTQSADSDLEQACTLATGHAYDTSIVVTRTAGNVCVVVGGTEGTDRDSADTFAETITVGSSNNKLAVRADADFVGTVDTYSVKSARLYPVNGFQTAIASDVSGNGNHATLTGFSTARQVTAWTNDTHDGIGQALTFDGTDDYASVGALGLTGARSYSLWIKPTNVAGNCYILDAGKNNNWLQLKNKKLIGGYTPATYYVGTNDDVIPTNGLWYHIAMTQSADGVVAIYVDGAPVAVSQISGTGGTGFTDSYMIGTWGGGGFRFAGTMDDIRVYDVALSAAQIAELYACAEDDELAGLTPVAHWTFEDGPSYTVSDGDPVLAIDSCEGNRLRFAQDNILKRPLWIANVFGDKPALRFDGVDDYLAYVGAALSGEAGTVVAFLQLSSAPNAAQTLLSQADTAGDTRFLGLYPRLNNATPNVQYSQNDAGTADTLTGSTEIAATTVYCLVWDTGGTGGIIRAFVNGVAQTLTEASGANNGDWWADITGADVTALGALVRSAATLCGAIDLAELIVYSRVLTPGELARVLRYGTTEYGVSP